MRPSRLRGAAEFLFHDHAVFYGIVRNDELILVPIQLGELDAWTLSNKLHLRIDLPELERNRTCRSLTIIAENTSIVPPDVLVDMNFRHVVAAIARKTIYLMGER